MVPELDANGQIKVKELEENVQKELYKICKKGGLIWTRKENKTGYEWQKVGEMPRGFLVLRAEVICDLKEEKNYKTDLTLHSVFQGSTDQCDRVRDYIKRAVKAFKGLWRKEVTTNYNNTNKKTEKDANEESKNPVGSDAKEESKNAGGVNTMNEEQEDELFEKTKMGWQFRDLYIELDHEVA